MTINVPNCPVCDRNLDSRNCKYICPKHGVILDCSDPC